MEVVRNSTNDFYWKIENKYGEVPKELSGLYTSQDFAQRAIEVFQSNVRSKVRKPKVKVQTSASSNQPISN